MRTADTAVLRETDSWVGRELGSFDLTSGRWLSHLPEVEARASSKSYHSSLIRAVGEIVVALPSQLIESLWSCDFGREHLGHRQLKSDRFLVSQSVGGLSFMAGSLRA